MYIKKKDNSQSSFFSDATVNSDCITGVQQKVAFHAKLRNDLGSLTDNEIIIMRSGLVQLGTGYDGNTGIFTCQVAGLYVFSVTILVERNGVVEVELIRNGYGILDIYSGDKELYGSGSNMVLVELQVNDKIWVQVHDNYHDQGEVLVNAFTTFSGFLLYAQ
ncbi:Complement C1q tumor necrosis factor-related protein 5 [Mizuhopecten yessoensis]|uniref:Complement C1q tumor necrosis factor-related protein 5 n=1 Tax=Mizuhopecten yessoensis TaxID=6573 RepID=A0A210PTP2_MIZYE|nr:Complement C1q tumor necrosis factor-related protein 5 [Mizuhopecten yessoensis]